MGLREVAPTYSMNSGSSDTRIPIVVCADDFGLTDVGCESTLELTAVGAISAASCVVDGPSIKRHASALRDASTSASLGLHFNLTEGDHSSMRAGGYTWLLRAYLLRSVGAAALQIEIRRQLDLFESLFSRAPAHVDGHEHVHQLPGVAQVLVEELVKRYGTTVAVRSTVPRRYRGLKARIIANLGGMQLRELLHARQMTTNDDFAGVYDFSTSVPYEQHMHSWATSIAEGGLIMCHPERPAFDNTAPTARNAEHLFLSSAAWPAMLKRCGVRLVPFAAVSTPAPSRSSSSQHEPTAERSA